MVFQIQRIDYQRFNDLGEIFPKQSASSSPSTDAPGNPEPPTLNASSTSIPNRNTMIRGRVKSSSIFKLILFKTHHSKFTFCHKFF